MRFLLSLVCLLLSTQAFGQTAGETYIVTGVPRVLVSPTNPLPVTPWPTGGTSATTESAGTVTLGGTFQTVLAANTSRRSCLVQNTSTHIMYVYVGLLADATLLKSFQLSAGGSTFACGGYLSIVGEAINVTTSTTADPFVYSTQ